MRLDEDMHLHSRYSDGQDDPEVVLACAHGRGLRRICFSDHVRRSTEWVPHYAAHLDRLRSASAVEIVIGVEAKLLDEEGTLDLPGDLGGVDRVLVADHRLPVDGRLLGPRQIREAIDAGHLDPREAAESLLAAYELCASRHAHLQLQIAHPMSILQRAGIALSVVPRWRLEGLARVFACYQVEVEASERWRCPTRSVLETFIAAGVHIVASTDAHRSKAVGKYDYLRCLANEAPLLADCA